MALADLDAFKAALLAPPQLLDIGSASRVCAAGRVYDQWTTLSSIGVAPTTAVVPTNATDGSLGQVNSVITLAILGARVSLMNPGQYIICDRLSHQGDLVGNLDTQQTTNLPTAALTRYTTGAGVMMGLTVYSLIGATQVTVTVSYTNQAGTSGRTSAGIIIGGTERREIGRLFHLPFQSGDTGVRSVESLTLSATTGTAGNIGIVLFKQLYVIIADNMSGVANVGFLSGGVFGGIPEIVDNACLFPLALVNGLNAQGSCALLTTEHGT